MNTSKVIDKRYLRKVKLKCQGAVSTDDIVELFLPAELYQRIYCGLGAGGFLTGRKLKLTPEEVNQVSFALTAMANTLMDAANYLPRQTLRKHER